MSKRVSVRDVARAAGVSIGSVSRVLNASGYASPDARRRVLDAVESLGYTPDYSARHFRLAQTRTVGYVLPDLANPLLAAHLGEVERLMQQEGFSVLVRRSESPQQDRELVAFFESHRLEGIIASPLYEYADSRSCPFSNSELPVVIFNREPGARFDCVSLDHRNGVHRATEYLVSLGHRRIALLVTSAALSPGREKLRGYCEALNEANIPVDESILYTPSSSIESAYDRMREMLMLPQPPTAIVSIGTQMLSGALRAARERSMEIPKDLSVIGIGTMEILDLMNPSATSLRFDYRRSASETVRLMLERIRGEAPQHARAVTIPLEFVAGASCARPPIVH